MLEEEETVYCLIPKAPPVIVKDPLHVSKYAGSKKFETAIKRDHGTMGEPKEKIVKDPKNYLKAHSRKPDLPPRDRVEPHGNKTLNKPPVPSSSEIPAQKRKSPRNFVIENWKEAPKTKLLNPQKKDTFYTDKADYGKSPQYLKRVKKEVEAETAYWDNVKESMLPEDTETKCRILTEKERIDILNGLQSNLSDVKKKYAALAFGQDNLSFRRKKEQLEAEAAQYEADIKMFERQNVYITET